MSERINIWFDTDMGTDDANALICLLNLNQFNICGISAVSGNVCLDKTFKNVRDVLHFCHHDEIKVYKGANKPLVRDLVTAEFFHGENGLNNIILEDSPAIVEEEKAFEALYQKACELKGELVYLSVGPLTNLAIAIANHPDLKELIKKIVIMGGAVVGGNRTACAEYNIYADPEAAETVFKSGIKVTMCGLDVTNKCYLSVDDLAEIKKHETSLSNFLIKISSRGLELALKNEELGYVAHDVVPVIYLAYPEIFETYDCGVYVETQAEITLGKTVCDLYTDHKWEDRHVKVVMDVNHDKYVEIIKTIF